VIKKGGRPPAAEKRKSNAHRRREIEKEKGHPQKKKQAKSPRGVRPSRGKKKGELLSQGQGGRPKKIESQPVSTSHCIRKLPQLPPKEEEGSEESRDGENAVPLKEERESTYSLGGQGVRGKPILVSHVEGKEGTTDEKTSKGKPKKTKERKRKKNQRGGKWNASALRGGNAD